MVPNFLISTQHFLHLIPYKLTTNSILVFSIKTNRYPLDPIEGNECRIISTNSDRYKLITFILSVTSCDQGKFKHYLNIKIL